LLEAVSAACFAILVSATLATEPVPSLAALAVAKSITLLVDLATEPVPSLAALAAAKSITLLVALVVFLLPLPKTNSFTLLSFLPVLLTIGCINFLLNLLS
jgi:hypothetical protein